MAKALLRWVRLAPVEHLVEARALLTWATSRAGAHAQPAVRALAGAFAAEGMRPEVARAAWGDAAAHGGSGERAGVSDRDEVKVLRVSIERSWGLCVQAQCRWAAEQGAASMSRCQLK